jgi:hypothetical protein
LSAVVENNVFIHKNKQNKDKKEEMGNPQGEKEDIIEIPVPRLERLYPSDLAAVL